MSTFWNRVFCFLFQTQIIVQDLTKRNRQLENDNAALQKAVADLQAENQGLRSEKAALEAEVYRLKVANAELAEKNGNLERENNQLSSKLLPFFSHCHQKLY